MKRCDNPKRPNHFVIFTIQKWNAKLFVEFRIRHINMLNERRSGDSNRKTLVIHEMHTAKPRIKWRSENFELPGYQAMNMLHGAWQPNQLGTTMAMLAASIFIVPK